MLRAYKAISSFSMSGLYTFGKILNDFLCLVSSKAISFTVMISFGARRSSSSESPLALVLSVMSCRRKPYVGRGAIDYPGCFLSTSDYLAV